MEQKKRFPIGLVILALVAALFGVGTGAIIVMTSQQQQQGPAIPINTKLRVGEPAPAFTLNTLDGKPVSLESLRGKRVLVNFWAAWCPPCQRETPALQSAYDQLQESGVAFVGIGTQDETANLKKFIDDNRVTYTIIEDPLGKVGDTYGVLGLPTTVLIDSNGIVRKVFTGEVKQDQVVEELKKLN